MRGPLSRIVLLVGVALCLSPWGSPPLALGVGVVVALAGLGLAEAGLGAPGKAASKWLIQGSVVLLGLGMDLREVARAGLPGLALAAATIAATFVAGWLLGRLLRTEGKVTTLLSSGTAICGGSAIAAVGSVIGASASQMSVSLATVFILNGLGLYVFPLLGRWMGLGEEAFGTWAALGIHDVSSVVGAAAVYGERSLEVATAVKLSRALWIAPVAAAAGWAWARRDAGERTSGGGAARAARRVPVPWFIGLFVLAAAVRTAWPGLAEASGAAVVVAKAGMTLALFLIGAGLSRGALAQVGWRPLALGAGLWVLVSAGALGVVVAMGR